MDSGKQFNFSMNTAYLVFTAHNKSVINQILSLALTSWGYTRKKIMLETSHNLDSIVSKSTKWHSNLLLNHTTMYKENKQKYNSSVFLKNFGSITSSILLQLHPIYWRGVWEHLRPRREPRLLSKAMTLIVAAATVLINQSWNQARCMLKIQGIIL